MDREDAMEARELQEVGWKCLLLNTGSQIKWLERLGAWGASVFGQELRCPGLPTT